MFENVKIYRFRYDLVKPIIFFMYLCSVFVRHMIKTILKLLEDLLIN